MPLPKTTTATASPASTGVFINSGPTVIASTSAGVNQANRCRSERSD